MAECPKCKELQERVWKLEEALEQYDAFMHNAAHGMLSKLDDLRGDFSIE